jgi:6-pyruvoyl-tetrahydropterin synthase
LDRFSVYYAGFSASHSGGISHTKADTRPHGHDFRVTVEAKIDETAEINEALFALTGEFMGRTLEEMMPGAATNATGVAAWIMERLSLRYPSIIKVEVECAGHHGYVVREPRRTT